MGRQDKERLVRVERAEEAPMTFKHLNLPNNPRFIASACGTVSVKVNGEEKAIPVSRDRRRQIERQRRLDAKHLSRRKKVQVGNGRT